MLSKSKTSGNIANVTRCFLGERQCQTLLFRLAADKAQLEAVEAAVQKMLSYNMLGKNGGQMLS